MKVWILTKSYNDYNQYGEYFEAVFSKKPTLEDLRKHANFSEVGCNHLLEGGGRIGFEDSWYDLTETDCLN